MAELIQMDGSRGEGGGQILRTALALSVISGRAFRLTEIRARRPRPGLAPQHLQAVRVFCELSGASCSGDREGSLELVFSPGPGRPGGGQFVSPPPPPPPGPGPQQKASRARVGVLSSGCAPSVQLVKLPA